MILHPTSSRHTPARKFPAFKSCNKTRSIGSQRHFVLAMAMDLVCDCQEAALHRCFYCGGIDVRSTSLRSPNEQLLTQISCPAEAVLLELLSTKMRCVAVRYSVPLVDLLLKRSKSRTCSTCKHTQQQYTINQTGRTQYHSKQCWLQLGCHLIQSHLSSR